MEKLFMETDFVLHIILLQKIDSSVGVICVTIMFSLNGFWSINLCTVCGPVHLQVHLNKLEYRGKDCELVGFC